MKIQVLSDLHIEFDDFAIDSDDMDAVILAGDIHVKDKGVLWALEHIEDKPVFYVLGNHEFYGKAYPKLIESLKTLTQGTHVHVLEKDVYTFNGVNFMGCTLWTDFELFGDARLAGFQCQQVMTDYKKIRRSPSFAKLRSVDVALIHRQSKAWLEQELVRRKGEKNVVISHHGPSAMSLPEQYKTDIVSAGYVSNLEPFIEDYQPSYWVHGHLHNSSRYQIGTCEVVANPRGYPMERNVDFDARYCVEL